MTIQYDPTDFNEITVLMKWRGTIMPIVLCRPVMWMLMAAHIGFFYLHMYREDIHMPIMPWKLTGIPMALLTFFLVFYSGNCFARYYAFYAKCMAMSGSVMAFTGLLRVHFPKAPPEKLWNLSRYAIASVYLLYFQLSGGASDGGKRVTDSEYEVLLQTGLIGDEEKARISQFRGFRPFLMQVWALRAVQDHLVEDKEKGPGAALAPFQGEMIKLRQACADIVDQMTQPIPFPYYHTLTLMLSLNLLLIAYAMIEFETVRGHTPPVPARPARRLLRSRTAPRPLAHGRGRAPPHLATSPRAAQRAPPLSLSARRAHAHSARCARSCVRARAPRRS